MDFHVLGPAEILANGRNIIPSAPKPRQVISLLMLRRNAVVRTDELIDELWGECPPASAMTTIQTYIYKLRKILFDHGAQDILSTQPRGYLLTVSDSAIDLYRFERDLAAGQELLDGGRPAEAAQIMRDALGLWRGRALADVEQGPLLSSYATRLEELRSRTLELRIEADLRLGRHRELISELKSLVLTQPLHEHLHASLMIALHRSGRRYEALEIYRTLRGNMVEDLGLEPGQELKRLHQALLTDSPPGWPPSDPGEPPSERPRQRPGRPGERSAEQQGDGTVQEAAAHASLSVPVPVPAAAAGTARSDHPSGGTDRRRPLSWGIAPPAQLPPDVADFTGRERVIEEILAGFTPVGDADPPTATPILAISGMPGVGKTALMVHLAHRLRPRFPDGQLYAELRGSTGEPRDLAEILRGFLRALGIPDARLPDGLEERSALFRSMTADHRLLVVVDDAARPADLRPLLPGDPRCGVVVTGRRRLHGLAGVRDVGLDVLAPDEGLEMLAHLTGRDRLERAPHAARRLVALGGGLPFALRCIGSRIAMMPGLALDEVAEQVRRSPLDLLRIGELDMRSAYDASYGGLSRLEQGIFRLLSMLPEDGFTAASAAGLLGWEADDLLRILERLVDEYLITVVAWDAGGPRYRLPTLTLAYARERLTSTLASMSRGTAEPDRELVPLEGR
ncbi:AfsR/SARP family transcriptional regulator [Actinomadura sp. KC345]|uniref:AfsR/SARP family transcriptional regulator n=1 Tax=Actinomadura sp. KC345 TaxID=2530371 RepID=UPI001048A53F|nr:AfsR/SARP family transcriptional regulator [Actinomadura sp. KC345]TDC54732.1 AfsR/SARP family transcriptional regulator [Actinomadura sp. KC345]